MARIAIIDLCFNWPPDGGAQTDLREIAHRLSQRHEVTVFVPQIQGWLRLGTRWIRAPLDRTRFFWKGKIEEDPGIRIEPVPFGPLSFGKRRVGLRFRQPVEKWKPDHVWIAQGWYLKPYVALALRDYKPVMRIYAHEMLCLKADGFLYRWGKACHKNYLDQKLSTHLRCNLCTASFYATYPSPTWIHEYLTSGAMRPSYTRTVIESLKACRKILVYNEFTADRVRLFSSNVLRVPGGVNTERFSPATKPSRQFSESTVILCMGRTEERRKGFPTLYEAARRLRTKRTDFEIWVTDSSKRGPTWIKHIGWTSHEQMPDLYRSVDIAVVPSLWPEPYGMVALEAMATGLPVVVSRIGGLQEVCVDEKSGLQFEPGNAEELAERLDRLLSSPQLRTALGSAARSSVVAHNGWDHIVDSHIEPLFTPHLVQSEVRSQEQ